MSGLFTHLKVLHFMLMCVVNTRDILTEKNVLIVLTLFAYNGCNSSLFLFLFFCQQICGILKRLEWKVF